MAANIILQKLIENERENLEIPADWQYRDLESFGLDWKLFPYQKNAVNNAIALLYALYKKGENNFEELTKSYRNNGLDAEMEKNISINDENDNFKFLSDYYKCESEIPFEKLVNRAAYWMATGSGKTLVMIKLLAVLADLINKKLIPHKDILVLAPKDDILNQIKDHVDRFNKGSEITIKLRNVKEYERIKNQQSIFTKNEITVFYYRADNISGKDMVAKKKDGQRLDYESIYNNGNWYLILDEAHKGEKETSKRQQYYLALTHNGFLFNFSATFTDDLDKVTTIFDYKLNTFLKDGYGKMLYISDSDFREFRRGQESDYTDSEKKNIITQTLIMLAVAKEHYQKIKQINDKLYHSPLLITLANSVNTEQADLKIFYELLAKIAEGDFDFIEAKRSLAEKLENNNKYLFGLGDLDIRLVPEIRALSEKSFRKAVFNSSSKGNIQVIKFRDNDRELTFKLVNSNKYFMLIHASDIVLWENNILEGYEFGTEVEESFFKNIEERPDINILLGSRIFSEGWDTNRPNIINFINIGISGEAQKYVLQSIGRGVRIQPMPNQRQRFEKLEKNLFNDSEREKIERSNKTLESLFVFATNKEVVRSILEGLEKQSSHEWIVINGVIKNGKIRNNVLPIFIPVFEKENENDRPFWIGENELKEVMQLAQADGPKILLLKNNISVKTYKKLLEEKNFKVDGRRRKKTPENILFTADKYFNSTVKKLSAIKILEDEISHYTQVKTNIDAFDVEKLEKDIKTILEPRETKEDLLKIVKEGAISDQEYEKRRQNIENAEHPELLEKYLLKYQILKEHYYSPILFKKDSENFQHIIKEESEIDFLDDLKGYLQQVNNKLEKFDWWFFSKIDQTIDKLGIPYFDNELGEHRKFFPDFIFWLKKGNNYYLKFIDPHGVQAGRDNSTDKIDGFNDFVMDLANLKENRRLAAQMYFYNAMQPGTGMSEQYRKYWTNDFENIFSA